jgi:formylmethanofuran dehydrogenase subunit C
MSALTFTLKNRPAHGIDLSPLTPDLLAGKPVADIANIELHSGNRKLRAAEVFDIGGDDASDIVIRNSCSKLDYIGSGMRSGRITVAGDAGDYIGFDMAGGEIRIEGNAGAFAASGMRNGLIHIRGNAGDYLGGAIAGNKQGMKGGTVIVSGNAGDRVGDQMRRGLLLIEGNAGDYCACRMIAGTIVVLGNIGEYTGYGMRRGTLLLTRKPPLHATIVDCGTHTLPFLSLMFKSFAGLPFPFASLQSSRARRYAGDIASEGKGEILVLE